MVIDTSAILAILLLEPDRKHHYAKILSNAHRQMSAASYLEAGIVLSGRSGRDPAPELDQMIFEMDIQIAPVTAAQAAMAIAAFRQYGKDRHPAGLNFGDCFSYALAKSSGESLLFKGSDFDKTDLKSA